MRDAIDSARRRGRCRIRNAIGPAPRPAVYHPRGRRAFTMRRTSAAIAAGSSPRAMSRSRFSRACRTRASYGEPGFITGTCGRPVFTWNGLTTATLTPWRATSSRRESENDLSAAFAAA